MNSKARNMLVKGKKSIQTHNTGNEHFTVLFPAKCFTGINSFSLHIAVTEQVVF